MPTLRRSLFLLTTMLVLGTVLFLMTWDEPPPKRAFEIEIPKDRLPD